MEPTAAAPSDRWSLTSWFTAFGGPDYQNFRKSLAESLAAQSAAAAESEMGAALADFESLSVRMSHLSAYLGCLSADDAGDEA